MKVAMTVWQQRVSPVFDVSGHLLLLSIKYGKVDSEQLYQLKAADPGEKLSFIYSLRPQILICGAMSAEVQQVAETYPWQLYVFMKGSVRRMMRALIAEGVLDDDFVLPGCAGRSRHCRGGPFNPSIGECQDVKAFRRQLCPLEKEED
jgi:hypothetical protein